MGDGIEKSWRDKLERLRKLPRPCEPSLHTSLHTLHEIIADTRAAQKLSKTTASDPQQYVQRKLTEYVANTDNRKERDGSKESAKQQHQYQSQSLLTFSSTSPVPECLNTFSDFYNPGVSAEERFNKYLLEMERQEVLDQITPHLKTVAANYSYNYPGKSSIKTSSKNSFATSPSINTLHVKKVVPEELRCSLTRERNSSPRTKRKYNSPRNKGGGWKVLPQIANTEGAAALKVFQFGDGERLRLSTTTTSSRVSKHSSWI